MSFINKMFGFALCLALAGCGDAQSGRAMPIPPPPSGAGTGAQPTPPAGSAGSGVGGSSADAGPSMAGMPGSVPDAGAPPDEDPDDEPPVPPDTRCDLDAPPHACVCLTAEGRKSGTQVCKPDGSSYENCDCSGDTSGGTGGTTSTGGTSGAGSSSGGASGSSAGTGSGGIIWTGTGGSTAGSGSATGGASGSTSTGGAAGAGGSAGAAGTGTGGSTAGASGAGGAPALTDCTLSFWSKTGENFSGFLLNLLPDGGAQTTPSCQGEGSARECDVQLNRSIGTEFWLRTGLTNPGPSAPGWVGVSTNPYEAVVGLAAWCGSTEVPLPVRILNNHFRVEPRDALITGPDWDRDGVPTDQDCDTNPSILTTSMDCAGGGGSSDSGTPVAFYAPWSDNWDTPLEIQVFTGMYAKTACQSVMITMQDPYRNNQMVTVGGVRCLVNVDRSNDFEFIICTGDTCAVGGNSTDGCAEAYPVYAYDEDRFPAADYDNSSLTSFPKQMVPVPLSDTCHLRMPAR